VSGVRIVSLLPSATEIVFRLGHGSEIVGRSAECDFPPEVGALPIVMRAKRLDAGGTSGEIDSEVRQLRDRGESLYALEIDLLKRLSPDVILTQDLCGVCSVTGDEVVEACRSAGLQPEIVALSPRTLMDVVGCIREVARAIDADARPLQGELEARLDVVKNRERRESLRISVVEWLDPPIVAGLWASEMIEHAGGLAVGGVRSAGGEHRTRWEALAEDQPDLLVLSPCSFPVEKTVRELDDPTLQRAIRAVSSREVWIADEAYFSRPGPRLWDGVELLADLNDGRTPRAPMPVLPWSRLPRRAIA
jgi:iron complex transport system substrate-binding protein